MTEKNTILMWVDLETTGVDHKFGHILEYAVIFTDLYANELSRIGGLVTQEPRHAKAMMDSYVLKMHTDNGLLEDLTNDYASRDKTYSYSRTVADHEHLILDEIRALTKQYSDHEVEVVFIIAGSNITFDVRWLMKHMPIVMSKMSCRGNAYHPEAYHHLDVSNYKVAFPQYFKSNSGSNHRAMQDIEFSLKQHKKMLAIVEKGWRYDELDR